MKKMYTYLAVIFLMIAFLIVKGVYDIVQDPSNNPALTHSQTNPYWKSN